ncbi:glycosyltransferase family 4 protein [Parapedobacter sp. 10938]|uniref:glycosyltransferase family 4 protein n=1 Tax=Parapedobacter flavus TaxID=3110225 RepID=UPI002DB8E417|nr:glycosyltransferase family 4 protein [Parapedobacter sp. 10938]MEC3881230.1 glycosyltransferase family 4 protein [Parapedobacter sp. 10938]
MKILYIHALYAPYIAGGAEISLKLLVEGMQAIGHEVSVLSLVPSKGLGSDVVDGVKVYRAGLKNNYWPFTKERPGKFRRLRWHFRDRYNRAMTTYVREVLAAEQPTVVSCHNLVGWSIAVWDEVHRAGIPIVQVLHDMYLLSPNSTLFKQGYTHARQDTISRLLRRRHRWASARLSAVVGISRSIMDRFTEYGYFENVPCYVVHNARDIPAAGPPRHRSSGDGLTVGYIGTISATKGVEWLISQFKAARIDGQLRIAGKGKAEDMQRVKQLAGADSRIDFVGYVASADFCKTVDVLVVPSLWEEPLGMVAVEGLANHLPVVVSNRGGLRETVVDGENGMHCDPDKPESLGQALVTLWKEVDVYNRMAAVARDSVSEYLSVERMVNEYEHILGTALADHAGT